jgi:uncharacterized protein YndB with AHSA1/START domain
MTKTTFFVDQKKPEVVIERIFDAPREVVFQTYTDPSAIPKWWGPKGLNTTVEMMDVKVGGMWRFVQEDSSGKLYAFNGVYHEVVPNEKLVYAFEFEGMPGHILIENVALEDSDGKTKVTDRILFDSIEDREGMLNTGMQAGATESMDRFADLLTLKN